MKTAPIPHNRPQITDADQAAVASVLDSGWLAQGPRTLALEETFSNLMGGGEACALSSGTAALFLALKGLDLQPREVVAVPTYACSALLNAIHMAGGTPLPVDVRGTDFCLDPERLEETAGTARLAIAVHTFGASAPISSLARGGRQIIEDCCQSLGGPQGHAGAAAVFSFYATKIVTGGQGGLVWDAKGQVADAARDYRQFDCRPTYRPRFNLQMTDIQAAMILSQLDRLDAIRQRRRETAAFYDAAASELWNTGWRRQQGIDHAGHLPYRYVLVAPDWTQRKALAAAFAKAGISTIVPMETHELLHRYLGLPPETCPVAEDLSTRTLSLPLYPALTCEEVKRISAVLESFK
ncbi:DegT/DnrJ/EryC1/StrS family aminotransferase [Roseospirillum parvum]|uniref:dTDP-4-amino-4,6-dideoxygalactose transaminase n=1 Tax=Roseospirillum parvum TaxID=83401 RepID=A0A1G8A2I2_9PROT|nr:DegT/DnrJ/EryC1/StrS aminotransferase family protein [Roseospirillum parvum]SDH15139.1 dTDP-4-amino-4,6-dideoxygalactose transaminase [Roseospirillum parvum]